MRAATAKSRTVARKKGRATKKAVRAPAKAAGKAGTTRALVPMIRKRRT
jgi:hypothetical protein